MRRVSMIPAQYQPSLDALLDKLREEIEQERIPEWGLAPCRPGEMLEITIRRVVPEAEQRSNELVDLIKSIAFAPYGGRR